MQRQVTVYEASKNGKVTVLENVEATTLGELKRLMVTKGIEVDNMDFMEGVSNVVLRDDNSMLPTNIPYKGDTTNDLFIYLSLKNKKISSGMSRKEIYEFLKQNDLAKKVVEVFGRNYTQVATADLMLIVNEYMESNQPENTPAPKPEECPPNSVVERLYEAFTTLIELLNEDGCLYTEDRNMLVKILKGEKDEPAKSNFSDDMEDILSKF